MSPPPKRKAEPLAVPVVVRFRESEVEELRSEADERGVSVSQVIRERVIRKPRRPSSR